MEANDTGLWESVSATFSFLSQIANTAPDEASVRELLDAVRSADEGEDASGFVAMRRYADECAGRDLSDVARELGVDWTTLFRGMNRQSGPKPPYAGVWLSHDGVGVEEMCAVNACYVEAGLGAGSGTTNRHDYFGVELEFVGRLALRIAEGDADAASLLASFLDCFVLPWFGLFVKDACAKGTTAFWKGYLALVEASLQDVRGLLAEQGQSCA